MNLLSAGKKEEIRRENKRRFIIIVGVFSTSLVVIAIVLLLPSFFLLIFQQDYLSEKLSMIKKDPVLKKAEDIEEAIQNFNKQVETLQVSKEDMVEISSFISDINRVKPSDLNIETFIFEKVSKEDETPQISLRGYAQERDGLLVFIEKLENSDKFSKVISPVSNLLTERDFNFSLVLKLRL